jgi:2-amino-4-hydroxy-6-hydroxymethyldihydropteridine diphosphokinase
MLRGALEGLARTNGVEVVRVSSAYETAPQGPVLDQADFLNACVEVETALDPEELLAAGKAIEAELGRESDHAPQGPRPIDVDLLTYGEGEYRSERIELPHADILTRRFVLEPLLELDPDLALPDGTRLADARTRVLDQPVERVEPLR